ncbi:MAG: hypothetical protein QW724_04810 [Nitrososphaerota archaeon]
MVWKSVGTPLPWASRPFFTLGLENISSSLDDTLHRFYGKKAKTSIPSI